MSGQILYLLGVLTGLAVGAVLWYGRRALADRARDGEGVTISYANPAAAWAINEVGGMERVQRGMEFDAFPPGTILDGTNGTARAARLADDGEWEVQYDTASFYSGDVRPMFIRGDLVLRAGDTP